MRDSVKSIRESLVARWKQGGLPVSIPELEDAAFDAYLTDRFGGMTPEEVAIVMLDARRRIGDTFASILDESKMKNADGENDIGENGAWKFQVDRCTDGFSWMEMTEGFDTEEEAQEFIRSVVQDGEEGPFRIVGYIGRRIIEYLPK
ncbi:MAG: hypothetical protein ISN28_01910 [Ectothiorhodospiraceae bacterium AqS1]|nr:hypothetical protein [Ectothiorhodospiraceae bacterium AqS1]